ncbi:hypothetical protein D3C75_1133770 [compost metagenome]
MRPKVRDSKIFGQQRQAVNLIILLNNGAVEHIGAFNFRIVHHQANRRVGKRNQIKLRINLLRQHSSFKLLVGGKERVHLLADAALQRKLLGDMIQIADGSFQG